MSTSLQPIASGLWTEAAEPQLLGARDANGNVLFPVPEGDAATEMEVVELSRKGTLWSYTSQEFQPKTPYDGPEQFEPFLLGYIELPEAIVESYIVEAQLEQLQLGMAMELVIVPFDDTRSIYAFKPVLESSNG